MKSLLFLPICLVFFFASCGGEMIEVEEFQEAELVILNKFQFEEEDFSHSFGKTRFYNSAYYTWTDDNRTSTLYKFDVDGKLLYQSTGLPFTLGSIYYRGSKVIILNRSDIYELDLETGELISERSVDFKPLSSYLIDNSVYYFKPLIARKEYEISKRDLDNFDEEVIIGSTSIENPEDTYSQ